MSEADFYATSAGQYRGSKYPGFAGGSTDSTGNFEATGPAANVSQTTGNNSTPAQVQQQQVATGNTAAQTGGTLGTDPSKGGSATNQIAPASGLAKQDVPSTAQTLGGLAAQGVLPAIGDIAGSAGGAVLGAGGSLGDAAGAAGDALSNAGTNLMNGNIGTALLGSSSGAGGAVTGSTVGSTLSSAGTVDGLQAVNVGTSGVDSLGENAISQGASAGSDAAALGGAGLSGVGTFAADLLSGQGLEKSALSGIGSAAGAYIGSAFGPIGTVLGGFAGSLLGGLFGNKTPTVGPNGDTLLTVDNGQLGVGLTGADNGADPNVTTNAANSSAAAINKILTENNLTIDPTKLTAFGNDGKYYNELSITQGAVNSSNPHSALDIWNNLLKANAIVSKTPSAPTATNNVTTVNGPTAPVAVPGSVTANPVKPINLTGAIQP